MKIVDIIREVRLCIDEEDVNDAAFSDTTNDSEHMDNIIRAKIGDALRWVSLYAPPEVLSGSDEKNVETGVLVDVKNPVITPTSAHGGTWKAPENFLRLARVRVAGWHRAVRVPIAEDSEEYLQIYDNCGATATEDRPQAALIETANRQIEIWPWSKDKLVEITYVASTDGSYTGEEENEKAVALPPRVRTSFIYYIAFLLLSAYGDNRANRMLEIAKMSFGREDRA